MVIIADTSCLILYSKIDRFDILQNTFTEITVTREVAEEYGKLPNWFVIREVIDQVQYSGLREILGRGEASSISLALEINDSLLVIDEKKGRRIAEEMNIEIIGSMGILLKAKENDVIKSVANVIEQIDKTDFRLSHVIRNKILKAAGE